MVLALLELTLGFMTGLLVGALLMRQEKMDQPEETYTFIDEYPDALCPSCGGGAAICIPASRVGAMYDFIVCYGCGKVSIVEPKES